MSEHEASAGLLTLLASVHTGLQVMGRLQELLPSHTRFSAPAQWLLPCGRKPGGHGRQVILAGIQGFGLEMSPVLGAGMCVPTPPQKCPTQAQGETRLGRARSQACLRIAHNTPRTSVLRPGPGQAPLEMDD